MWSVVRHSKSVDDNSDIFPTPVFMLHSEGLKVNLLPVLEHNNPVTPVWCFVSTLVPLKLFLNCSRIIIQHCCVAGFTCCADWCLDVVGPLGPLITKRKTITLVEPLP